MLELIAYLKSANAIVHPEDGSAELTYLRQQLFDFELRSNRCMVRMHDHITKYIQSLELHIPLLFKGNESTSGRGYFLKWAAAKVSGCLT